VPFIDGQYRQDGEGFWGARTGQPH
jgi:hypothetical protein